MTAIPAAVVKAVQSGATEITRRLEIYEADAKTIWDPEGDDRYNPRLIDGSISVDYTRDERRTGDFSLDNRDNQLRPEPFNGFWYDKIIKIFRGVKYRTNILAPRIVIVDAPTEAAAYQIRGILVTLGFDRTDVNRGASYASVQNYDIFVAYNLTGKPTSNVCYKQAYQNGKKVLTFGDEFDAGDLPWVTTTGGTVTRANALTPSALDSPLRGGWTTQNTTTSDSTLLITGIDTTATIVATDVNAAVTYYTAVVAENSQGGRWFHYTPHQIQSQGKILIQKAVEWVIDWKATTEWEGQVAEFMIDRFSEANAPKIMKVSCRDMAKKMLLSKLEKSISFAAGTPINLIVTALAANSGITKLRLPAAVTAVLGTRVDLERGTPRWQVCKDICTASNLELYFDAQGYLVIRPFIDPSFGPISHVFKTGPIASGGNLVSYERSADDSRLFNHVIVVGERENETLSPFYAEVKNTNPSSPTRIDRIGDRLMDPIVGTYFTSNAQCMETAHNMMKVAALESYQLSFSSIMYQWLEVGEVVQIIDPDALVTDPDRYLLDSLTLPMTLGPMSGTGKRVTLVQDDAYVQSVTTPQGDVA